MRPDTRPTTATTTTEHTAHVAELVSARAELAQLDQWVVTKYVTRYDKTGQPKQDKPPFTLNDASNDLRIASHSQPADWLTYAVACETVAQGLDGCQAIGFVFHQSDPYTGVDFDGCRNPETGVIDEWAMYWIRRLNSYTEISISGTGVKVYVRGKLPKTIIHKMEGGHTGIEVYGRSRYFWFTGNHLPGTPETINDSQAVLDEMAATLQPIEKPKSKPTQRPRRISPGEQAAENMTTAEIAKQFNNEHDLARLLEHYDAKRTRSGYSCPFCDHSHKTTLTIAPGGRRGYSHSPTCKLYNSHGFDALNVYAVAEHNGDVRAAIRALAPERPIKSSHTTNRPTEPPTFTMKDRDTYNAQRRERRRTENRAALSQIAAQVAPLDLVYAVPPGINPAAHSRRAHALFSFLHQLAADAGNLQVRPTNAEIVAALDMCLRYVRYAFRELEAAGIGKRHGGRGGQDQPNEAAIWTFYRAPNIGCKTQQDAECTLDVYIHDLNPIPIVACEAAPLAPQPARAEPDSLDVGEWCEPDPDDLALALADVPWPMSEQDTASEQAPPSRDLWEWCEPDPDDLAAAFADDLPALAHDPAGEQAPPSRDLLSRVRSLAKEVREPGWLDHDYGERTAAALEAEVARLQLLLPPAPAAHADPHDQADADRFVAGPGGAVAFLGGAAYVPDEQAEAWYRPLAGYRSAADLPAPVQSGELPDHHHELEAEPEIRCPPTDPEAEDRYYALREKAKKAVSPAQRRTLNQLADKLMIWLPASQAPRLLPDRSPPYRTPQAARVEPHAGWPEVQPHQAALIETSEWGARSQATNGAVVEIGVAVHHERQLAFVEAAEARP